MKVQTSFSATPPLREATIKPPAQRSVAVSEPSAEARAPVDTYEGLAMRVSQSGGVHDPFYQPPTRRIKKL